MLPSLAVLSLLAGPAAAIWPLPTNYTAGEGCLSVSRDLRIAYNGNAIAYKPDVEDPSVLTDAAVVEAGVARALNNVFRKNFVPWKLRPRGHSFEPAADDRLLSSSVRSLNITLEEDHNNNSSSCYTAKLGEVDEGYSLRITAQGEASLTARSAYGILHGLETFSQLFYQHSKSRDTFYTCAAPVTIDDTPAFPHRGLLLDTARHFVPVREILRTIDALAYNKFNRLHIHATDSQSWPLDIPALPGLARNGAYAPHAVYTAADLDLIQRYGQVRGVQALVEIDMPGHIGSVWHTYPDLIVAYNEKPYSWWCAQPPCGAFRMNSSEVYDFVDTLLADVLPRTEAYSPYFHMGGDELNRNDSMLDPDIRSNDTEVLRPLLQKFVDHVHGRYRAQGRTPIVWEEIPLEWAIDVGDDVLVQAWLGAESVQNLTRLGLQVIDTDYHYWYMDCGRGQWLDFAESVQDVYLPYQDWCGPTKSWRLAYAHNPTAGLTEEQARLVVGGEAALWSETIDSTNMDSLAWPRSSATGEILWSGPLDAAGRNRSHVEASPRLADWRERMVARGIGAAPVQMTFCTQSDSQDCLMTV